MQKKGYVHQCLLLRTAEYIIEAKFVEYDVESYKYFIFKYIGTGYMNIRNVDKFDLR